MSSIFIWGYCGSLWVLVGPRRCEFKNPYIRYFNLYSSVVVVVHRHHRHRIYISHHPITSIQQFFSDEAWSSDKFGLSIRHLREAIDLLRSRGDAMARGVPELCGQLSVIATDVNKLRIGFSNVLQERLKDNNSVYYDPVPSELEVRRKKKSFIPWIFIKLNTTLCDDGCDFSSIQFHFYFHFNFHSNWYCYCYCLALFPNGSSYQKECL